ncbi:MAG: hypothetical protein IID17_14365, partial [Nitrospinae bacterium]|nr:hypothetical protein [Nitrospinota bacterium]
MELNSILFSRIAWAGLVKLPIGGAHMPLVVEAVQHICNFVEYPENLSEFILTNGIKFRHGDFVSKDVESGHLVIGELVIFNNGIIVTSESPTEGMDIFLNALLVFMEKQLDIKFDESHEKTKIYTSQLEVTLAASLPQTPVEKEFIGILNKRFPDYGINLPQSGFEKSGVNFSFDISSIPDLPPIRFGIERRTGRPYPSNAYFTEASVPTSVHLGLL